MRRHLSIAVVLLSGAVLCAAAFIILRAPVKVCPRIAIVLDDWGYNESDLAMLYEIKSPVTLAILPDLKYSEQIAREAEKRGYQTILHLPIESKSNRVPEKNMLYGLMDDRGLREQLSLRLKSVPGISGVNNHQGSKGTEDIRMMSVVLSELKDRELFFLDSVTTSKSVCAQAAKIAGIRFAQRDVFLDTPPSRMDEGQLRGYIVRQLDQLARIAIKKGYAIGIGHDRRMTLSVLKDVMPFLETKGFKFVFVSELLDSVI